MGKKRLLEPMKKDKCPSKKDKCTVKKDMVSGEKRHSDWMLSNQGFIL
jgi:hypothetical protein